MGESQLCLVVFALFGILNHAIIVLIRLSILSKPPGRRMVTADIGLQRVAVCGWLCLLPWLAATRALTPPWPALTVIAIITTYKALLPLN